MASSTTEFITATQPSIVAGRQQQPHHKQQRMQYSDNRSDDIGGSSSSRPLSESSSKSLSDSSNSSSSSSTGTSSSSASLLSLASSTMAHYYHPSDLPVELASKSKNGSTRNDSDAMQLGLAVHALSHGEGSTDVTVHADRTASGIRNDALGVWSDSASNMVDLQRLTVHSRTTSAEGLDASTAARLENDVPRDESMDCAVDRSGEGLSSGAAMNPHLSDASSSLPLSLPSSSSSSTSTVPTIKTRRSSTLSSTSSSGGSTYASGSAMGSTVGSGSGGAGHGEQSRRQKGGNDPSKPARRKAARTTSFEDESQQLHHHRGGAGEPELHSFSVASSSRSISIPSYSTSTSTSSSTTSPVDPSHPLSTSPVPAAPPPAAHVDIVSYPSSDLLRLLAALLEQIARANDELHQRTASAGHSGTNTPISSGAKRRGENSSYESGRGDGNDEDDEEAKRFERGRFDAAPLNSPATPRWQNDAMDVDEDHGSSTLLPHPPYMNRRHGSSASSSREQEQEEELPVTPGIDLQREVEEGGGGKGFMPSLGGAHAPMPLGRRRGSSFLKMRGSMGSLAVLGGGEADPSRASIHATLDSPSPIPTPTAAINPSRSESASTTSLLTASSLALASPSATLCFHARNVPAISIEAYLLRILKYCPTTNEVFLSLLVYFDRMARVGLEAQRVSSNRGEEGLNGGEDDTMRGRGGGTPRLFSIDSFNIHRLIIAGVTVASKFFSDVFYTNSRYAKVGGLPLNELNQLELQFLLLNDFRLVIPVDELQRYADQLILFWIGRDGTQQHQHPHPSTMNNMTSIDSSNPIAAPSVQSTSALSVVPPPFDPSSHHSSSSIASPSTPIVSSAPFHSTPSSSSASYAIPPSSHFSHSTAIARPISRPTSIRSAPSSSGTSFTSTVTPGTPTTPRGGSSDGEDEEERSHRRNSGEIARPDREREREELEM